MSRSKDYEYGIQYRPDGPITTYEQMSEALASSFIWGGGKWTHRRKNSNYRWEPIPAGEA